MIDLWQGRELLFVLAWRNISVHYKRGIIGLAWIWLRPTTLAVIYTVLFGQVAQLPSAEGLPYPLLVLSGILVWFFFSSATAAASQSFLSDASLVSKVYLPRLVIPLSHIAAALVDFFVMLVVVLLAMAWFGMAPEITLAFLPGVLLALVVSTSAVSIALASLAVRFADVKHAIPFLLQVWIYASPVVYSSSLVPEHWRWLYFMNPMSGAIESFRSVLFGLPFPTFAFAQSVAVSVVLLGVALKIFVAVDRTMADRL